MSPRSATVNPSLEDLVPLVPARDVFPPAGVRPSGDAVRVPFMDIARSLPKEILLLANPGVGGDFEFSARSLVPQLATGAVKVTFSELRAAAPAGLFRGSPATGDVEISLPLSVIVPRIDPARLGRRVPARRWDAPPEINNLFGPKGAPIKPAESFFTGNLAPAPSAPASSRPVNAGVSKPPAPVVAPAFPAPAPAQPAAAMTPASGADVMEVPLAQLAPLWPAAIIQEIRRLGVGGHPVHLPVSLVEPALRSGKVCFTWQQIAAWIHPEPPAVSPATAGTLLDLPLRVVAPLFVARFRARENQSQKRVKIGEDIPDVFGNGASVPASPADPAPIAETLVVAPLAPPAALPAEPETVPPPPPEPIKMPSLSLPKPEPVVVPVPPAPAPLAIVPAPAIEEPAPPASRLGALFGDPRKAEWSPAEIVQKVAAFPGITGAAIALPEGLPIAAQLPPTVNAEAFAGFMPQMFARIAQYTRELKFGEILKLSLEVNGGHVVVFHTGRVYFGVVGEGATLPTAQLALVASELSTLNP